MDLWLRKSRAPNTEDFRYCAATSFVLGIIVLCELLSLGTAAAQVGADTALPNAPSATRQFEGPISAPPFPAPTAYPPKVPAPATPSPNSSRGLTFVVKRGARDQKEFYTAPFRRRNLKWDALFVVATGGLIAADKQITGAISHDNPGTSQTISDIGLYSTLGITGVLLVSGTVKKNEHAQESGLLGFEAAANTLAVDAVIQVIAGRERPLEGAGHGRFWVNNALDSSFPSLHSGVTWSMATVLAHEYPHPWVQLLAYGTATTVSVTRVTGLKHFPADVAVGGVIGYVMGQHIFRMHSRIFRARQHKPERSFTSARLHVKSE